MVIPLAPKSFEDPLDPKDWRPYKIYVTDMMDPLAGVDDWEVVLMAEAVALGLIISEDIGRAPSFNPADNSITLWFEVDVDSQADAAFDAPGSALPMEVTITTDQVPFQVIQRTTLLTVVQQ